MLWDSFVVYIFDFIIIINIIGIYCNNIVSSIDVDEYGESFLIESGDAKKMIDLKKYYNLIKDKEKGLCGSKIKGKKEYYNYQKDEKKLILVKEKDRYYDKRKK